MTQDKCYFVTSEDGGDIPAADASQTRELSEAELHDEERSPSDRQEDDVRDEEGTCHSKQSKLREKT